MATVAASPVSPASPPPPPQHGSTAAGAPASPATAGNKPPRSRMLRSISRFLSGGGSKQRPKLPNYEANQHTDERSSKVSGNQRHRGGRRARGSSSRSSPAGSDLSDEDRGDTDDDDDENGDRADDRSAAAGGSTRAIRRYPRNDSVSRYSAVSGADTDASLYAVASTRPASSLRTVDSSSHASSIAPSAHGTHKSYASTKPTTLLSVDSLGGANRIAVVPGTGGHSAASPGMPTGLSFASALPSTPPQSSPLASAAAAGPSGENGGRHHRAASTSSTSSFNSYDPTGAATSMAPDSPSSAVLDRTHQPDGVYVPNYSHPHPRNNPHPAYPAQDNASILTLASSSFAPSFIGSTGGESKTRTNSWGGGGLGGLHAWSSKHQARSLGGGARSLVASDGGPAGSPGPTAGPSTGVAADEDASVRALAGSRRGSDESLGGRSTWSAAPRQATPSVRSRMIDDEVASGGAAAAAAAGTSGAPGGSAPSLSPSKRERRTSMFTVGTAPSIRSLAAAEERRLEDEGHADGEGPAVTPPAVVGSAAALPPDPDLLAPHHAMEVEVPAASPALSTTTSGSAAASFTTALEPGEVSDDRTSIGSIEIDERDLVASPRWRATRTPDEATLLGASNAV
ncbi:hypothetical protein JCM8202_005097 [Rhodotorula sphaerocarpa]